MDKALILLILLSGCTLQSRTCDWGRPIYLHAGDVISDRTAREIVAHNEAGEKLCGWQPPKGSTNE